jgi:hypothetical protein
VREDLAHADAHDGLATVRAGVEATADATPVD